MPCASGFQVGFRQVTDAANSHRIWIAHCAALDLFGDGPTKERALEMLTKAAILQFEAALEHKNYRNVFVYEE